MKISELIKIGTLGNSIDKAGFIRFKLYPEFVDIDLENLFLIFKDNKVRYVSVVQEDNNRGSRFLLDDTEVMTEAAEERNVFIALTAEEIAQQKSSEVLSNLRSFKVIETDKLIGEVAEVLDNGFQKLIVVKKNEGDEFMIPWVEHYITEIDLPQKQIIVADIGELIDL
jgi:ribosomal 30S subunit maturation factor RimM